MKLVLFSSILLMSVAAYSQSDIRKVDFNNFTYTPACAGEKPTKVRVKNGEFESEKQEDGYVDRFYFKVYNINYGDVTGDGKDDAVMLSICNTGGTGNFTEGFIYSISGGKAVLTARIPGGDRADGGLRDVKIEKGLIVIEYNDGEKNSGACCPEGTITEKLRFTGRRLVPVGSPVKHDLFPTQRVRFAKGASGASLALTIPSDEGKRLIVGARAGQTLTVTVDNDKADVRLLGDVETTNITNGITTKLPKNGDYTVQVTNYEESDLKVTVTIKID